MTGEELYSRYAASQDLIANCIIDSWCDLPQVEQDVWHHLAREVVYIEADE